MIDATHQNFPPGAISAGYAPRLALSLAPEDIATLEQATKDLRARASNISWAPGQRVQVVTVRAGDVFVSLEVRNGQTVAAVAPTPEPEPAEPELTPAPTPKGKRGA